MNKIYQLFWTLYMYLIWYKVCNRWREPFFRLINLMPVCDLGSYKSYIDKIRDADYREVLSEDCHAYSTTPSNDQKPPKTVTPTRICDRQENLWGICFLFQTCFFFLAQKLLLLKHLVLQCLSTNIFKGHITWFANYIVRVWQRLINRRWLLHCCVLNQCTMAYHD